MKLAHTLSRRPSSLVNAQNAGVPFPREPEQKLRHRLDDSEDSEPDDKTILNQPEKLTDHVSRVAFPVFLLERGEGYEMHENAYWGFQTYLGLQEGLAANESACSFTYESVRERTPFGHAHREHA